MKNWIIFLDIDGVLNNLSLLFNRIPFVKNNNCEDNMLCQHSIRVLNKLVEDINAKVVLSSAWRIIYTKELMNEILQRNGATFEITDYTESLPYERGTEISKWLRDNIENRIGFNKYIILDDESDMLLNQKDNFFQIDPEFGLTSEICCQIVEFVAKIEAQCEV